MTGTPKTSEPFYFEFQKLIRKETILDVEITVPTLSYSKYQIRKEDSMFKEVTIFFNYWSRNEITFR